MTPSAAARSPMRVPGGLTCAAAAVLAAVLVLCAMGAPASARPRQERDSSRAPLAVSIDSITPSTVPRTGEVTLTGEIRNRSGSEWTDLRVYLFMSSTPMTTSTELKEATVSPETEDVGGRLTDAGLYTEVSDLSPGDSTFYSLSVPASELPVSGAGVYWIGVHVLGTNEEGRLDGADGRARTFIAAMPPGGRRTSLAVALPLRAHVRRGPDGRIANVKAWNRSLSEDGRLQRLLDVARAHSGAPVTWLVDPAVLEAVRSLAEGNPPFDISPTDQPPEPSDSPSGPAESSPGATDEPSPPEETASETPGPVEPDAAEDRPTDEVEEVAPEPEQAQAWLEDFTELARQQTVLVLPYGDVDVATVLRHGFPDVYDRAGELADEAMEDLGIDGTRVVAPWNGRLPNAVVPKLDPDIDVMLSERATRTEATTVGLGENGPEALLTSDVARTGGPGPTPRFAALAVRQRILAEAAVRGLDDPAGRPLVVTTPDRWDPGSASANASFFAGLDVPWIRMVDVPFARILSRRQLYDDRLVYTRPARRNELPVANVLATQELDRTGRVFADLLARNDTIDGQLARVALLGSSSNASSRANAALRMTRSVSGEVHGLLSEVRVEGSPLVTLSSGTGNMTVRVVNGLEEPVTVGLEADAGTAGLRIREPDLVTLGPGQRASVRLAVTATGTGFHSVRITPTTPDGEPLGTPARVKVRSSQVGLVIWLIMGTGAVVFFAAIVARIVRRVRDRKQDGQQVEDREQEEVAS